MALTLSIIIVADFSTAAAAAAMALHGNIGMRHARGQLSVDRDANQAHTQ